MSQYVAKHLSMSAHSKKLPVSVLRQVHCVRYTRICTFKIIPNPRSGTLPVEIFDINLYNIVSFSRNHTLNLTRYMSQNLHAVLWHIRCPIH